MCRHKQGFILEEAAPPPILQNILLTIHLPKMSSNNVLLPPLEDFPNEPLIKNGCVSHLEVHVHVL